MQYTPVSADEFADAEGVDDWRRVLGAIHAEFQAASFSAAGQLAASIAEAADAVDHHPDIEIRYPGRVRVALTTHATGGLTTLDVELARQISRLAATSGAHPQPH